MSTDYATPLNENVVEVPQTETAQRNNRLIKGEIARLTLFIDTNLDRFRGKGWTEVSRVASESLPFMVTPANIRDLCQSEHLPHFAAIDPKVQEELLLERIVDLGQRMERYERECAELRERLDAIGGRVQTIEHDIRPLWKAPDDTQDASDYPGAM